MKNLFMIMAIFLTMISSCLTAQANGPWNRFFQDAKFPSQAMMDHYTWTNPALGSTTVVLSQGAAVNGSIATFTSFSAQPDFPRNITITPVGSTNNVVTGTAVVVGTNIFGRTISENFAIATKQVSGTATTGNKAFKTVTSVSFPAVVGSGVVVDVGTSSKLGLPRCMTNAGDYVFSEFGGVFDSTRGTIANSASTIESNTFLPNTAMDGAHNVDLFYVQNYQCYGN